MIKRKNYLDKIPFHSEKISFDTDENGIVTLKVENTGFANRLAQKLLKKPRTTFIKFDETGSFVWLLIDGKKSVYEIAVCIEEHFGEASHPLYERLIGFLNAMSNNGFINFRKQK